MVTSLWESFRSILLNSLATSAAGEGRLLKAKLVEAYGPDIALPDLRSLPDAIGPAACPIRAARTTSR